MDIYYNQGKILSTIAELQRQSTALQDQDQAIRDASGKLAGAWDSGAASTFQEVQKRWNDEFVDTQQAMRDLISAVQEALDAALRTDGLNASRIRS